MSVAQGNAVIAANEKGPAMEHCAIDLGGRKSQICIRASNGAVLHDPRDLCGGISHRGCRARSRPRGESCRRHAGADAGGRSAANENGSMCGMRDALVSARTMLINNARG